MHYAAKFEPGTSVVLILVVEIDVVEFGNELQGVSHLVK
jgi:hypothetical protein